MFKRQLVETLKKKMHKGKAIILLGARQTGKTTLIKTLICGKEKNCIMLNADEQNVREELSNASTQKLKQVIGSNKIICIDEAQRIQNVGLTLKLITDNFPKVQLIVSGSSALELASEINEPLTGRKWEYNLYPLCWAELREKYNYFESQNFLEQRLIYGMYPDVVNHIGDEKEVLTNLADSYLYKDLLNYKGIRKPDLLYQLLKALALQIGNEVSYNELAQLLKVDKITISNYIDLLEKSFIIFKLNSFSGNLRNEIAKGKKIYFYDNGIRNAIIQNYSPLSSRIDTGALWENFLISERIKKNNYNQSVLKSYFWRTTAQQEVDYIEEVNQKIYAYEFKWNAKKNNRFPKTFLNNYKTETAEIISQENFEEFIL